MMLNPSVRFPALNSWNLANFSAAAKGKFIKQAGLAGFALWEVGGDYNNILLNAINGAISGSS